MVRDDNVLVHQMLTSVTARWSTDADAKRGIAYFVEHERSLADLVWALSSVMSWIDAYFAVFAYVAYRVGTKPPSLRFC
jgi:hypothetical protein